MLGTFVFWSPEVVLRGPWLILCQQGYAFNVSDKGCDASQFQESPGQLSNLWGPPGLHTKIFETIWYQGSNQSQWHENHAS